MLRSNKYVHRIRHTAQVNIYIELDILLTSDCHFLSEVDNNMSLYVISCPVGSITVIEDNKYIRSSRMTISVHRQFFNTLKAYMSHYKHKFDFHVLLVGQLYLLFL